MANVFFQRRGDRRFLGLMVADPARFFNQAIVNCKVSRHVWIVTHRHVWGNTFANPEWTVAKSSHTRKPGTVPRPRRPDRVCVACETLLQHSDPATAPDPVPRRRPRGYLPARTQPSRSRSSA